MRLYITATSPYARVARMMVLEKGLEGRVDVVLAQTRTPGSPYYAINPSGRVPFLVCENGVALEDSQIIAAYLDQLGGGASLMPLPSAQGWTYGRLEGTARSMVDGISVWVREMRRPKDERSPTILGHEAERARRLASFWEREIEHPLMHGDLNMAQMLLIAGIDQARYSEMADFEQGRPKLANWARQMRQRPSITATAPPAK